MTLWFRRLADIQDVAYAGAPGVNRNELPGHDIVPKLSVYTLDGKRRETLMWPTANGQTGSSPAALHARVVASPQLSDPSPVLLCRLHEALELPGTTADYHFAIQGCVQELWKRRRTEPHLLPDVERLCWLDIRLIEAQPNTIAFEREGGTSFVNVLAFGYLIELYSREGFLNEALEVAQRGVRLHQTTAEAELRKLAIRLEAEES
jgi:hypothetical protein